MLHPAQARAKPRLPYDPLLVDWYEPDDGARLVLNAGAIDTIKGGARGLALTLTAPAAGQRPLPTKDSLLKGAVTLGGNTANARCVANTSAGTIVVNASRPYTISVIRLTNATIGNSTTWAVIDLGVNAASDRHYTFYQTDGAGAVNKRGYYNTNSVSVAGPVPVDTLPHVIEFWADGTNLTLRIDGTSYQTASNVSVGADCTSIGIGRAASSNVHTGNMNHAFHAIYSAKPSDAYIRRLKRYLLERFGVLPS